METNIIESNFQPKEKTTPPTNGKSFTPFTPMCTNSHRCGGNMKLENENPALKRLKGYIFWDKATIHYDRFKDINAEKYISYLNKAKELGASSNTFFRLGRAAGAKKQLYIRVTGF